MFLEMPKIRKQQKKSKCKRLSICKSSRKPPQTLLLESQTESFDTISVTRLTLPIFKMNLSIDVSFIYIIVYHSLMILIILYSRIYGFNWFNT